jgi:hypothetical protein
MFGTYISAALICAASLLVGRAAFVVTGRGRWTWLEPAVGLAAIMTVAGIGARLPGAGTAATVLLVVLLVLAALTLRRPYGIRGAVAEGAAVAVVIALVLAIPFAVSGRWGLLGVGFNNDLGLHLAWSEWLRSGFGPKPEAGYPLGPHGLSVAVAALPKIDLGRAFIGQIIAITILTGLTALAALRDLGPVRRVLAAALVAIPYLAASYYAQAAFKETAEALFVLAFTLSLPGLRTLPVGRRAQLLAVGPLLVLTAGIFFSYSFAGLAWPVAIAVLWALTIPEVRREASPRALWGRLRRRATLVWGAVFVVAVLLLAFVGPFGFAGGFNKVAGSNTYGPVSPVEAFGVWPAANYRLNAAGGAPDALVAALIGGIALVAAAVWWVRRRELAVPVAVGACALLYLGSLPFSGDYSRAKALMIAAPLVMLLIARALLSPPNAGATDGSQARARRRARAPRVAWAVLAVIFFASAVYSSFLVLREAPVAPPGHGAELAALRARLHGQSVLYAGQDRFAAYELLGADTHVPLVEFPDPQVEANPEKPFDTGDAYSPIDFDSFDYYTLNHHNYVVTGSAAWNSQAPKSFKLVGRTPSYLLWKQRAKSPKARQTFLEGTEAAAPVHCASPEVRIFTEQKGVASIFPTPVFARKGLWDSGETLQSGDETSQTVNLPAGRWRLSLQYFAPMDLTLSAPGFSQTLKAALDGQRPNTISLANDGQYWPAGVYDQKRSGPVRFTLRAADASTLQKLTGWDGTAYLGNLVAVPEGPHKMLPLSATCGRWIDWYFGNIAP